MLRPRWLAQAVAFGILCLGGAGLAVGLAQIHDNVSSIIFGMKAIEELFGKKKG